MQWLTKDIEAAKNNYTLALLSEHKKIDRKKIKHENLKKFIEKYDTEMACAYAYLGGEFPFPHYENSLLSHKRNNHDQKTGFTFT